MEMLRIFGVEQMDMILHGIMQSTLEQCDVTVPRCGIIIILSLCVCYTAFEIQCQASQGESALLLSVLWNSLSVW